MPENQIILPALKPDDWLGREHAICRPLVPEQNLPGGPWIGFGYNYSTAFEFITQESLPAGNTINQVRLIEQAAVRNLQSRPVHWKIEEVRTGLFRRMRLLVCGEDALASERILDKKFLLQAQIEMKTSQLAVGIPYRGLLIATDAHQNAKVQARFSAMVSTQYHRAQSIPISPRVFLVQDGEIIGILTGQEAAGKGLTGQKSWTTEQVYINPVVITDPATQQETLYLLTGSQDLDQLTNGIKGVFLQSVEAMKLRDHFCGSVQVVLLPEFTPQAPGLANLIIDLQNNLQQAVKEASEPTRAGSLIQVSVLYGTSEIMARISQETSTGEESLVDPHSGLNKSDVTIRRKTAQIFGETDSNLNPNLEKTMDTLIEALDDEDVKVRTLAAEALAHLGEPAAARIEQVANQGSDLAREFSLTALRMIDDLRYYQVFLKGITNSSAGVRRRATGALVDLIGMLSIEYLRAPLLQALSDESPPVRALAASGLGRLGDKSALGALIGALSDPEDEVRSKAAHALGELKDPRATPYLISLVKDQYMWARIFSVWAIGELGDPRGVNALVAAMVTSLEREDIQLRNAARRALKQIGQPAIRPLQVARAKVEREKQSDAYRQISDLLSEIRVGALIRIFRKRKK